MTITACIFIMKKWNFDSSFDVETKMNYPVAQERLMKVYSGLEMLPPKNPIVIEILCIICRLSRN